MDVMSKCLLNSLQWETNQAVKHLTVYSNLILCCKTNDNWKSKYCNTKYSNETAATAAAFTGSVESHYTAGSI